MPPSPSVKNAVYRALSNAKLNCKESLFNMRVQRKNIPDFQHVFTAEFGIRASFALNDTAPTPSLAMSIRHVVGIGPKKKMGGIAAWGIIARMQSLNSIWNGTVFYCRAYSVGEKLFEIERHGSVTAVVYPSLPRPALIATAFINTTPKSFNLLFGKTRNGYRSRRHDRLPFESFGLRAAKRLQSLCRPFNLAASISGINKKGERFRAPGLRAVEKGGIRLGSAR